MNKFNYPISIRPLEESEGGGYLAEFPDLPGCMADGDTVEEALHEAQDALKAWKKETLNFNKASPYLQVFAKCKVFDRLMHSYHLSR